MHIYFKRRFPNNEILQLEWGYNLVAGCRRFKSSPDIRVFWGVLLGEVCTVIIYEFHNFEYLFRLMKRFITEVKTPIKNNKRNCNQTESLT